MTTPPSCSCSRSADDLTPPLPTSPHPVVGSGGSRVHEVGDLVPPGVDPNDPAVKSAIEEAQKKKEEEDGK